MDWKAQIETAVQAGVKAALERCAFVEERMDEMARRRRHYIELAEDRMRRDPVWAEKVARRRAAFAASSTSPASASILTAGAPRDVNLAARSPATCSTNCPSHDTTSSVSSATPTSSTATGDIVPVLAEAVLSGEALDINNMGCDASTTAVRLLGGSDDRSDGEELVSMSAPQDKPEGTDTAVTHEDEHLLVCSKDVAGDHNFVIGTYAIPLALAVLGVGELSITKEHKVALPLKLMELPLFATKEQNMSPLLPQFTQAMVAWGTSLNLLHDKCGGMCSYFSSATTHSLLPWDPGEKTKASWDSVPSSYIAWRACDKQSNADSSVSSDHHQMPWHAKTPKEFTEIFPTTTSLKVLQLRGNFSGYLSTVNVNYVCTTRVRRYLNDKDFIAKECGSASPREHPIYAVYFWKNGNMWKCSGKTRCFFVEMLLEFAVCQNGGVGCRLLSPWDPGERTVGTKYLEVSSTEHFLGTRRFMKMPVRWPSLREEEFIGSKNLSLQYIVETMGSQLAEGFCFLLPPAKPPDNIDECILAIYSETVCALSYRLITVWICDLIIARNSLCTTLENARQLEIPGMYNVTAVLSRLFIRVVMWNEAALWPSFQFDTGNTIPLLHWDPGLPLSVMDNKLSEIEHGLVVRLPTACEVNYLQGSLIHSQLSCSLVIETILNWMVTLMELQPWPPLDCYQHSYWELMRVSVAVQEKLQGHATAMVIFVKPPPAKPLEKSNYISADRRVKIQWSIRIVNCLCNCSWLEHASIMYELMVRQVLALHTSESGTTTNVLGTGCCLFVHRLKVLQDGLLITFHEVILKYSEMTPWSINDPISQSGFGSCPMGNILFFHGALVQWKNYRIISLASLQFLFQYCSTGCESLHCPRKFRWAVAWVLSSQFALSSLQTRVYGVILLVQQHCPAICQEKWYRFLAVGSSGAGSACVCLGIVTMMFWPRVKLGLLPPMHFWDLSFWRYPSVDQMMLKTGHVFQCGIELIQWRIAWTLHWEYFGVVNQSKQLDSAATLTYLVLYFPWDPGIWALLCFFGFFTPAEEKGGRDAAAPVYYCGYCLDHAFYFDKVCADHDYYLGVFLEQVRIICYLHFVKVCVDFGTRCNLVEVVQLKVPWDPGGSTRHRLEVKPKFKEGGMLATLPCIARGWTVGCSCWAWATLKRRDAATTYTKEATTDNSAWIRMASASLLLSPSSSSRVPLSL